MFPHLASFSKHKPNSKIPRWTVTLKGAGTPGTTNLRLYVTRAELPQMDLGCNVPRMPDEGHKSHRNVLSVCPEDWRKLTEMSEISGPEFDYQVTKFIRANIPSHDLHVSDPDIESGERLTVPCTIFRCAEVFIGRPSDVHSVSKWVAEYPLATLQRVMHLVFPCTQEWSFSPVMADPDHEIVSCVTWDRRNPDSTVNSAVAVMIQPPWIASAGDLECFSNCKRLPNPQKHSGTVGGKTEYNSSERMWAKIWDFCARRNCHYFVVTTYWGWIFGAFSRGRSRGFVTSVKSYTTISPSILEHLVFWFASAMQISGAWEIPEIAEAVFDVNLGIEEAILAKEPHVSLTSPTPSESAWGGDYFDEADAKEVDRLLLSPKLAPTGGTFSRLTESIMKWQQYGTPYDVWGLPPSVCMTPSEGSSSETESSGYVCIHRSRGHHVGGDWLTGGPVEVTNHHRLSI
ncbi:hypothetical protein BC629DRAFT_1463079 [Irpex lacteus]|nr:hypothetical protein BC629DRAFT_1463079 [Irpex lacteus]